MKTIEFLGSILRHHGQGGIPVADAESLFVWLYCSPDVLPDSVREDPPSGDELVALFGELVRDGTVALSAKAEKMSHAEYWRSRIHALLSEFRPLDQSDLQRMRKYLQKE